MIINTIIQTVILILIFLLASYIVNKDLREKKEDLQIWEDEVLSMIAEKEADFKAFDEQLKKKKNEVLKIISQNETVYIGIKIDYYDIIKQHEELIKYVKMIKNGERDNELSEFILNKSGILKKRYSKLFESTFSMTVENYENTRTYQHGRSLN